MLLSAFLRQALQCGGRLVIVQLVCRVQPICRFAHVLYGPAPGLPRFGRDQQSLGRARHAMPIGAQFPAFPARVLAARVVLDARDVAER